MDYPMTPDANNRIGALEKENYELSETVAQLQEALMFWLPNVPDAPEDVSDRVAKDAWLLAGYQGQDVPSAEKRGWIAIAGSCATTSLTDEEILKLAVESGFTEGGAQSWGAEFVAFARALLSAEKQQSDTSHVADNLGEVSPDRKAGLVTVPIEPTPEMIASAAIAVWPVASAADIALARKAAPIVLMQMDMGPGSTVESIAAILATMAPAYRAMIAAAPKLLAAEAKPQNEAIRATDVRPAWKVGNEYAPYHPSASHVSPDYRDGWNACYYAAPTPASRLEADAARYRHIRSQLAVGAVRTQLPLYRSLYWVSSIDCNNAADADEVIDAAMSATKEQQA